MHTKYPTDVLDEDFAEIYIPLHKQMVLIGKEPKFPDM